MGDIERKCGSIYLEAILTMPLYKCNIYLNILRFANFFHETLDSG